MSNTLQHGRWIVSVGAVMLVVSSFLQWWVLGGGAGELPAQSGIGIDGVGTENWAGLVLFLAALATLLLIALPYAAEGPMAIDQPIAYVILLALACFGFFVRSFTMYQGGLLFYTGQTPPVQPLRGPGYWLAGVALLIFARGVFELWEARKRF
jgi:hypothetical protein